MQLDANFEPESIHTSSASSAQNMPE